MSERRQPLTEFVSKLKPDSRLRTLQSAREAASADTSDPPANMDKPSKQIQDSVSPRGLDTSMRPEKVRYEASKGWINMMPEHIVMHQIKRLAIMVYEQEKFTAL